ncbi:XrtA/PEP-CTERM system histidine kinase PrsK [Massilia polaris]|uniref:XrtA/PEP-CTERM system histidine kinase PrsK n=1 Tax=Massilia polaris TaxID=2728846 RepID=UPI00351D2F7B
MHLINIATFSYAVCALAFLLLAAFLLSHWRGRARARPLAGACLASALWSAAVALESANQPLLAGWTDGLEILRSGAWSAIVVMLIGRYRRPGGRFLFQLNTPVLLLAGCYVLLLVETATGMLQRAVVPGQGLMPALVARIGIAVVGMLLVEQLYRNKSVQERWAIKFACLGIGGMFAYDFYMYSDTMLFRGTNPDIWGARGIVNALTVPMLAVSMGRSASWSTELALSRRVMFHSAALFGSAIYLLAMASAGYFLLYFGGSWGKLLQVSFLFGAVFLLIGILFSGTFRAWLKVFISKHFYSYNYDYREEWLRFTKTLSEQGPKLSERSLQAVGELVESAGGVLWLRRDSGMFEPVAGWHSPPRHPAVGADAPLCSFLESRQWVIDLDEYAAAPEMYDNTELPAWLPAIARGWLVVPLMLQGRLFGFMLLLEPRSKIKLNWEVIDLLKIAGSQAAGYLAQQEAAAALMAARQFESFNRMSTFVVHDLKNLVSQLSLLIPNAEKHKDNPEFQRDMLETVTLSVQKMRMMLQKLSRSGSEEQPTPLLVDQLLQQAIALKAAFQPRPLLMSSGQKLYVFAERERLERVLGHLIQNAIEATPQQGAVTVKLSHEADSVVIEVADTGTGMSEEFIRERLFKPFDSTKSAGMGIGAFESREYIHQLGGELRVSSEHQRGTTFRIALPRYPLA